VGNFLKLMGYVGGPVGALAGIVIYLALPEFCELSDEFFLDTATASYNCFNLGDYPRLVWATGLGGVVGLAAAGVKATLDSP
jgi:hypothetical protein